MRVAHAVQISSMMIGMSSNGKEQEMSLAQIDTNPIAPPNVIQYLYAFLIAIALVLLIDACTNSMPPVWDGKYYVDMARSGISGNPNLVAPFAYRPGMPFVSHAVANFFSISIEDSFRIVVRISAILFLMSIFMLSRSFTMDYRHALLPMVILGLSWQHIKFPFFFYSLVDVAAYPLIVIAFWALITKRLRLCLFVSSAGLLFKEFLAIPWLLLVLQLVYTYWCSRSRRDLIFLAVSVGVGMTMILIPRLYIPIVKTHQFVDPINGIETLKVLLNAPLDEGRIFNIIYATAGYWLPTLLLLSRSRFNAMRADLVELKMLPTMLVYFLLVTLLAMYGGINISIFVSYSVAIQAFVLALIFRHGVSVVEVIFVIAVMIVYNKTMLHIPLPSNGFSDYIDFYGGFASRVNMATVKRFLELAMYVAIAASMRWIVAKLSSDVQQNASANADMPDKMG